LNVLIDTNVISEVRKGERCDAHVARWYDSIPDESLYLSVLVLGEVRNGIERARPKDAARARALERWLAAVRAAFAGRILPIDDAVAEEWGRMSAGRPVPVIDGLLAATAKVHRLTLATRNTADVAGLGADVVNPFGPVART
jgi:predicted nucleic acid-binding protein